MRILAAGILLLLSTGAASAQGASCAFTVSDLNFGIIDALSGSVATTFGTVTVDCTNDVRRVCPNIGAGSGGATAATRFLSNASTGTTLDFQLYSDGGQVWGSTYVSPPGGEPPAIDLDANGDAAVQINGRATPALTRPGTYSSSFTDTHFVFGGAELTCSDPSLGALGTESPSFTASAILEPSCSFQVQGIDFGSHGLLNQGVSATGDVAVTCTSQTGYTVSLGPGGAGPGTAPSERRMASAADGEIRYGLYQDAAFTQGWGDAPGTNVSGVGSGSEQHLPVYAHVPSQATPAAGTYTDTVVVTVTITE